MRLEWSETSVGEINVAATTMNLTSPTVDQLIEKDDLMMTKMKIQSGIDTIELIHQLEQNKLQLDTENGPNGTFLLVQDNGIILGKLIE